MGEREKGRAAVDPSWSALNQKLQQQQQQQPGSASLEDLLPVFSVVYWKEMTRKFADSRGGRLSETMTRERIYY